METTKEIGNRSAFSTNETKKETVLSRSGGTRQSGLTHHFSLGFWGFPGKYKIFI